MPTASELARRVLDLRRDTRDALALAQRYPAGRTRDNVTMIAQVYADRAACLELQLVELIDAMKQARATAGSGSTREAINA